MSKETTTEEGGRYLKLVMKLEQYTKGDNCYSLWVTAVSLSAYDKMMEEQKRNEQNQP